MKFVSKLLLLALSAGCSSHDAVREQDSSPMSPPPQTIESDDARAPVARPIAPREDAAMGTSPVPDAAMIDAAALDASKPVDGPAPLDLSWSNPIDPGFEGIVCADMGASPTAKWLSAWTAQLAFAHHVNLWVTTSTDPVDKWCNATERGTVLFDASQPNFRSQAPLGGAIRIPAGARLLADVHELNTETAPSRMRCSRLGSLSASRCT